MATQQDAVGERGVSIDGRTAVVTGGSRGIGFASARALVERGARVALLARGRETLERAAAELGDAALPVAADVADPDSVRRAFAAVDDAFGRLDVLVNNAGVGRIHKVEDASDEDLRVQVGTNWLGVLHCTRAAIPALRETRGQIVNVSSDSTADPFPLLSVYAATKGAVELFSRALRVELAPDGIRVSLLRPGPTLSSFGDAWSPEDTARAVSLWTQSGHIAPGAVLAPEEVGEAVAYLVTRPPEASVDFLELRPSRGAD